MDELTDFAAIKLLNAPLVPNFRIPHWFKPEYVQYLFPMDRRPLTFSCTPSTPAASRSASSPEDSLQTSSRRTEDKSRREAMHTLLTTWDKSAKTTARDLVSVLFKGCARREDASSSRSSILGTVNVLEATKFLSLIPNQAPSQLDRIMRQFGTSVPSAASPMFTVGGHSLTETKGPLSLLSRAIRQRIQVVIWVKEKVGMSHGTRRVRIARKRGRVVLFDRYMNIVYVPAGNASDHWQFIRGATVALVQIV